ISELRTAIETANANSQADVINLTSDIEVTADHPNQNGNAVRFISSDITINGGGHQIFRNASNDPNNNFSRFRFTALTGYTELTLNDITFENFFLNDNNGGGVYARLGAEIRLYNTTIANNFAGGLGGGILNFDASITLRNSIIAGSMSGSDCVSAFNSIASDEKNIIQDGSCGTSALAVDPKLDLLNNNGGRTRTHALLKNSPAIDAGNGGGCAAAPVNNLDQRGERRPFGDVCDIGAIEFGDRSNFFVIPLPNGKSVTVNL
ncbi:MAG: hypothetical protein KTR35_22920, partial [Gammaproteobacteria bacterium]|nr:hypothetical protein [Gammaproteobacteria bacterium]